MSGLPNLAGASPAHPGDDPACCRRGSLRALEGTSMTAMSEMERNQGPRLGAEELTRLRAALIAERSALVPPDRPTG